jgi:hypothetical protein
MQLVQSLLLVLGQVPHCVLIGLAELLPELPDLGDPQLLVLKARFGEGIGLDFLVVEAIDDFLDGLLLLLSLLQLHSQDVLVLGGLPLLEPVVGHHLQSVVDVTRTIDQHSLEVQPQLHLPLHRWHQLF